MDPDRSPERPSPREGRRGAHLLLAGLLLLACAAEGAYLLLSPRVPLLPPGQGGEWIRAGGVPRLQVSVEPKSVTWFRKRFDLPAPPGDVACTVSAFRRVELSLDGVPLPLSPTSSWKRPIHLRIPAALLAPGGHVLAARVENDLAPALFRPASTHPAIDGPAGWESSPDGVRWGPALPCDEGRDPADRERFPTVPEGILRSLPLLLPLFLGGLYLSWRRRPFPGLPPSPGTVRFLLLAAWALLGTNNLLRGTRMTGFDVDAHMEYTSYILFNHRLPLASEGSQMFQAPLHYLLSAGVLAALPRLGIHADFYLVLLVLPLVYGLLLVEVTYRCLREFLPGEETLQSVGLLVGGLLPMNLYMCQSMGNEPLAALLVAVLLLLAVRELRRGREVPKGVVALLGAVAGLAVLAKVTAVLLVPPLLALLLLHPGKGAKGRRFRVAPALLFLAVAAVVSGWYFARNVEHFGKPFVGGWDPARGIAWWQFPGYRLAGDFLSFGESLRQPVFSSVHGLPDAFYSSMWGDGYLSGATTFADPPEWNLTLLAAAVGLSVVPAAAVLAGFSVLASRALREGDGPSAFLSAVAALFLAALVHLYATVPVYSQGKASYTMGLTPAYAVAAALGAGIVLRRRTTSPFFLAALFAWAAASYVSFFIA
jgi:hypothetical protein